MRSFARPPVRKFSSPTLPVQCPNTLPYDFERPISTGLFPTFFKYLHNSHSCFPQSLLLQNPVASLFRSTSRPPVWTMLPYSFSSEERVRPAEDDFKTPSAFFFPRPLPPHFALVPFFSSYIVFISVETTKNGSGILLQIEMFMLCLTHQFGHNHLHFIFDKVTGGSS